MKKEYNVPSLVLIDLQKDDVCTASAGTLEKGEFENTTQWWN